MCDFEEGELAEYLLYLEAARARSLNVSSATPTRELPRLAVAPMPEAAEA